MTDSDTSASETVRLGDNAQISGDVFTGGKQVGVEVGAISNISGGQVNVAGGHIIHAEAGATVSNRIVVATSIRIIAVEPRCHTAPDGLVSEDLASMCMIPLEDPRFLSSARIG